MMQKCPKYPYLKKRKEKKFCLGDPTPCQAHGGQVWFQRVLVCFFFSISFLKNSLSIKGKTIFYNFFKGISVI
jgi:hypothetical protein